ncbi:GerAB/ArcD/ProY family transporter [Aneurinibacillus terranovensis]|uniref:GerAB/ArcD/ProY family transporter n=1 Tax=Aneurinibacillus terranovensis TaxID=278991 RepID=UPI000422F962|nr:endospore germination permease [Aneurinibacillus terranovensis]
MEAISERQLILIGAGFVLQATLINVPSQIIKISKQNSWFSIIPAFAVCILSIWLIAKITSRFPHQDLFGVMVNRFKIAGRFLSSLYILFFFIILSRDIRNLTEFINIVLLQRTPLIFIALLVMIPVVVVARGGIEVVARMAELYFPIIVASILILPPILLTKVQFLNFMPIFEKGLVPSLQGSWYFIGYLGDIIILPFLFSHRTFTFREGVYSLLWGSFLTEILLVLTLLVFGPNLTGRFIFPTEELVRQIRLGDFLDRLDLVLVSVWLPTMIIRLSATLYVICHGLNQVIPNISAMTVTNSMGAFVLVCALWFYKNNISLLEMNRVWPFIEILFMFLIPFVLFLVIRRKKPDVQPEKQLAESEPNST